MMLSFEVIITKENSEIVKRMVSILKMSDAISQYEEKELVALIREFERAVDE